MVVIINYGTCVRKGNGWRSGEATLKNGKLDEFYEFYLNRKTEGGKKQKSAVIVFINHGT